jgi:L,D-peptidoglycan transpeptidase YkuD (ErfK/YbiS/YcfS/YnhG family)
MGMRTFRIRWLAVMLLLSAATSAMWLGTPRPTGALQAPPGQVITVEAATLRSTTAQLTLFRRLADGTYARTWGPVVAYVGIHGVGRTREGLGRTPSGVFTLTQAFGNQPNNGTRLPYFLAGPDDWWDENPSSPGYNRHVVSRTSPGGTSENLFYAGIAYSRTVVINYNTDPVVKGKGSGFFLHVSTGSPTAGCVSIPAGSLTIVMHWLQPSLHPVISIAVGSAALAVVSTTP